jgi:cyclin E
MAPFALTLREAGPVEIKTFSQIPIEDTHNIQTHNIDLSILVFYLNFFNNFKVHY